MQDAIWFAAMRELDKKSAMFQEVIDNYIKNSPESVKKSWLGKYQRIEVNLPQINGFENQLIAYQSKSDGVKACWYVIFNEKISKCYKRDLLDL